MQEQPHYLHLKYKGLFQPYSWPSCSSIITADIADKFIYLNCTLPSSAIIADKYLSLLSKQAEHWVFCKIMSGAIQGSCTHPESVLEESGFICAILHDPP